MMGPSPSITVARRFGSCGSSRAGFSLVEVLVALFILALGAASLLSLFAAAATTHRRAADRTNAALVAERVFSELRASYFADRSPEEVLADARARLPESVDGYRHEALVFHPEGEEWADGEMVARVVVRWTASDSERAEVFHRILIPRHSLGPAR